MFDKSKPTRDLAKFFVFSHLGASILSVILSGLVATVINFYYQYSMIQSNTDLSDIRILKTTLIITVVAALVNLPLTFCSTTFFHEISSRGYKERVGIKEFFEPFSRPLYLLKGTLLMFILMLFNMAGILVLVFPVYLSFCMAPFILKTNPEISVFKALSTSFKMMYGHKMTAFKTLVPVLGVYMLFGVISGFFYFVGYFGMLVTEAVFSVVIAVIFNAINARDQYKDILISRLYNTNNGTVYTDVHTEGEEAESEETDTENDTDTDTDTNTDTDDKE